MIRLLILVLALLTGAEAFAGGYVHRNGYYWRGSQAFTRTSCNGYYTYNGRRCYGQYYSYKPVTVVNTIVEKQTLVEKLQYPEKLDIDDYRLEALKLAVNNARQASKTAQAQDIIALLKDVSPEAEYQEPLNLNDGGQYAYRMTATRKSLADQGSTIYGMNYFATQGGQNLYDAKLAWNQAANLAENAQRLGGQATTDYMALFSQFMEARAQATKDDQENARLLMAGQIAAALMRETQDKSETKVQFDPVVPGSNPPRPAQPTDPIGTGGSSNFDFEKFAALVTNKCGNCHNSEKSEGGLNLESLFQMEPDQVASIIETRILTTDEAKRMPPPPHEALTTGEAQQFVEFYQQLSQ